MITGEKIKSEEALRTLIIRNLRKEIHDFTTPSMSFIKQILDDAYASDLVYDVSDLRPAISSFAACSSNNSTKCMAMISQMKFASNHNNT